MGTEAFLIEREYLQAALESTRAAGLMEIGRKKSWAWSLPFLPLAGFIATRGFGRDSNPLVRGFLLGTVSRIFQHLAQSWA